MAKKPLLPSCTASRLGAGCTCECSCTSGLTSHLCKQVQVCWHGTLPPCSACPCAQPAAPASAWLLSFQIPIACLEPKGVCASARATGSDSGCLHCRRGPGGRSASISKLWKERENACSIQTLRPSLRQQSGRPGLKPPCRPPPSSRAHMTSRIGGTGCTLELAGGPAAAGAAAAAAGTRRPTNAGPPFAPAACSCAAMGAPRANWPRIWAKTKGVFVSQFLLISYIVATVLALAWPVPGRAVVSVSVRCCGDVGPGCPAGGARMRMQPLRLSALPSWLPYMPCSLFLPGRSSRSTGTATQSSRPSTS